MTTSGASGADSPGAPYASDVDSADAGSPGAGEPLRTVERRLAFVRGTTTQTGLAVTAAVDEAVYRRGVKVSDAEMKALEIRCHDTCPQWNYTLSPRFDPTWN